MTLEQVKVGDVVAVTAAYGSAQRLEKIERITPTQVIAGNCRFNKKTGREVGADGCRFRTAFVPSEEKLAELLLKSRISHATHQLANIRPSAKNIDLIERFLWDIGQKEAA